MPAATRGSAAQRLAHMNTALPATTLANPPSAAVWPIARAPDHHPFAKDLVGHVFEVWRFDHELTSLLEDFERLTHVPWPCSE